jgi:hypothetical protein
VRRSAARARDRCRRRDVIEGISVAVAIWCCALDTALAQDLSRMPVVGVMWTGAASNSEPFATLFREELAARGDVEGRNLRLNFRFADSDAQRYPEMAEAFVKENASVIVVFTAPGARATQRATRTIPIIAVVGDFVADGLGASMANPGGNVTGVSMINDELEAKRLEILKSSRRSEVKLGGSVSWQPDELPETAATEPARSSINPELDSASRSCLVSKIPAAKKDGRVTESRAVQSGSCRVVARGRASVSCAPPPGASRTRTAAHHVAYTTRRSTKFSAVI